MAKSFLQNDTLSGAVKALSSELNPDHELPDASPEYRENLAIALFYKFILSTSDESVTADEFKSGGDVLERGLSSGIQEISTNKEAWPITKNVPKYDGLVQTAGEAKYVNDMPSLPNELFAAFILATEVHAPILHIDATEALVNTATELFVFDVFE